MPHFSYRAFGLDIGSDLELLELPKAASPTQPVELRIELVDSVVDVMPPEAVDDFFPIRAGACLLRVPDVADFLVQDGTAIRMAMHPQGDPGMAKLYLLGSALGLALHQRGLLVLHASAVLRVGGVTVFVGDSGAGKSTLAAELAMAGHGVLADDLLAVDLSEPGQAKLWPGARSFKLWADTLDALGIEKMPLRQVSNRLDKFFMFNPAPLPDAGYPVAEILVLDTCDVSEAPSIEPMAAIEAVRAISNYTYRPELVELLRRQSEHFRQCAELASQVTVARFRRPWDSSRIQAGLEFLESLSP